MNCNFINYTQKDIFSSICQDTIKRGVIIDHKLQFLMELASNPVMPSVATSFDVALTMINLNKFCQNMKFILYDRLESNCVKSGRSLVIGSVDRPVFEKLFSNFGGEREVKVLKKGRGHLDYTVYIAYKFPKGHKFLTEIPKKIEYTEEFYVNQGRIIRQLTHHYVHLTFLLDVQTNNVHCQWEQGTEKVETPKQGATSSNPGIVQPSDGSSGLTNGISASTPLIRRREKLPDITLM